MTADTAVALGSPELTELLAGIGAGAADRERRDESPFDQVAAITRAGLGAITLPVEEGGQGASTRDLMAFVIDLAEADPIVAHILRTHYHQVGMFLRLPDGEGRRRRLDEVRAGLVFGNATSETGQVAAGSLVELTTTVTERDGRMTLDGTKYYSTGTLYAQRIGVIARMGRDDVGMVVVPADRDGVRVVDDWDGMGARRTGTGTTAFADVTVEPDDVVFRIPATTLLLGTDGTFAQLYLHAMIAGILRTVVSDAAALIKSRTRTFTHAPAPRPVDDPILHERVGELVASAWVAEAAVLAAADRLDDVTAAMGSENGPAEEMAAATLAASAVKVHLDRVALACATAVFDVGGASSAGRSRNLDRHWRNIRTVTLHNPTAYKAAAVGRLVLTGEPLPANGYF